MEYELELDKVVESINQDNAKKVCIQLPDGLKPKAKEIVDFVKQKTGIIAFIYMGTCFGACDIPQNLEKQGFDLIVQFGHSEFINK